MSAPNSRVLITFFSPSGYEVKKDYPGAEYIFYLPMDSPENAKTFLDLVNPSLILFIKYDFWFYYLTGIKKRNINCLLISAAFREEQSFFKWYGGLQRKMLRCFTQIFVQDENSKRLLAALNIKDSIVAGDTRFDTVTGIAEKFEPIPVIENFLANNKCIVAGSTWNEDEEILQKVFSTFHDPDLKLILAPHETHQAHLDELKKLFPHSIKYSELPRDSHPAPGNILIIDNIGMLSRLYHYGYIAYVGGGFTKDGVHNVLEAAVYGKPVLFGKNYKKYREAIDLVGLEGAKAFSDAEELHQILYTLLNDEQDYREKCLASKKYVQENIGATRKILTYIEENRLLTR